MELKIQIGMSIINALSFSINDMSIINALSFSINDMSIIFGIENSRMTCHLFLELKIQE